MHIIKYHTERWEESTRFKWRETIFSRVLTSLEQNSVRRHPVEINFKMGYFIFKNRTANSQA